MTFEPNKPYNELPHIPPTVDLKDQDLLLATLEANNAIAQLKTMLTMSSRTIHNTMDLLSPLFIPEAVASSGIENIITTINSVYVAKILEERELSPAEKEAVYYTPPETEARIRDLLSNFDKYFNEDTPAHEIFARMAILHYQFEAIHPFMNGDGRTGRMLMPLFLTKQGRLPVPVLFISHYILDHRDEYYEKLRAVTAKNEWQEWILFITKATTVQALYTCRILERIRKSINRAKVILKEEVPNVYSSELVDFLFSHAYFTQKMFEKVIGVSAMKARKYLSELEKIKVIEKSKQTGKNRYIYINPSYIDILKQV